MPFDPYTLYIVAAYSAAIGGLGVMMLGSYLQYQKAVRSHP